MTIKPESKNESYDMIKMMYSHFWQEIYFRREREWKTVYSVMAFYVFLAWLIIEKQFSTKEIFLSCLILFVIILSAVISIWFLIENANRHTDMAKVLRKISKELGCYDKGIYIEGKALFPKKWIKFGKKKSIFYLHIAFIILFALANIILLAKPYFSSIIRCMTLSP